MGIHKRNYHSRNKPKQNGEIKNSRIVQVQLTGKILKDFDLEVSKFEETESRTARDLIIDGFRHRDLLKNPKHPFYADKNDR